MADPVVVTAAAPAVALAAVEAARAPVAINLAGYAMLGLGILLIVALVWIFVAAQLDKHSKVDLADLVLDPNTGRVTQAKWHGLIGGAAGTWVFVYLAVSGHFDATYAAAYLLAMMAAKVAGDITAKPTPLPEGASETVKETVRTGPPPVPIAADTLQAAGRGVEPMPAKIGPEDVGKKPLLGAKPKRRKRGRKS